jgi:hypothetical protein
MPPESILLLEELRADPLARGALRIVFLDGNGQGEVSGTEPDTHDISHWEICTDRFRRFTHSSLSVLDAAPHPTQPPSAF